MEFKYCSETWKVYLGTKIKPKCCQKVIAFTGREDNLRRMLTPKQNIYLSHFETGLLKNVERV